MMLSKLLKDLEVGTVPHGSVPASGARPLARRPAAQHHGRADAATKHTGGGPDRDPVPAACPHRLAAQPIRGRPAPDATFANTPLRRVARDQNCPEARAGAQRLDNGVAKSLSPPRPAWHGPAEAERHRQRRQHRQIQFREVTHLIYIYVGRRSAFPSTRNGPAVARPRRPGPSSSSTSTTLAPCGLPGTIAVTDLDAVLDGLVALAGSFLLRR